MSKLIRKKNVRGPGKNKPVMLRRIQEHNGCMSLVLPKAWCDERGWMAGQLMALLKGVDEVHIRPVEEK